MQWHSMHILFSKTIYQYITALGSYNTYIKYPKVTENLTFPTSRYKYVCVHIGAGGGTGEVRNVIFSGNFAYIL